MPAAFCQPAPLPARGPHCSWVPPARQRPARALATQRPVNIASGLLRPDLGRFERVVPGVPLASPLGVVLSAPLHNAAASSGV